jgi:uncharacterized membrane protein YfcA
MRVIALIVLGLASGALSGVTGMGGGALIVPALIYLFGYSVHLAQGTTLALLVPLALALGVIAFEMFFNPPQS